MFLHDLESEGVEMKDTWQLGRYTHVATGGGGSHLERLSHPVALRNQFFFRIKGFGLESKVDVWVLSIQVL